MEKKQTELYDCNKKGKVVKIYRTTTSTFESDGSKIQEISVQIDCSEKDECILSQQGYLTSYDWTQCVHPEMKR